MAPAVPTTWTFSVDNIGDPEPIIVPITCRRVIIREQASLASAQAWTLRSPLKTSPAYPMMAAEEFEFEAQLYLQYEQGQTIGFAETAVGATTFTGVAIP